MQIALDHITPKPLLDRLSGRGSDIWNQALTFQQEEIIRIKAPSGSGKTTLIHYLYQLRKDYTGSILWDHQETFSSHELAKLRATQISIVFQDLRLFPQLTAKENIFLKKAISKNEADINRCPPGGQQTIDNLAELLNLPSKTQIGRAHV